MMAMAGEQTIREDGEMGDNFYNHDHLFYFLDSPFVGVFEL